jgi:hypothetical protein
MSTQSLEEISPTYDNAFGRSLPPNALRQNAPAIFAGRASTKTKKTYRFINTAEVLSALLDAGFAATAARQTGSRKGRQSLTLVDVIPEIVLLNAHDGTGAWLMLIFVRNHWRESTCYPAYLHLRPCVRAMMTVSERLNPRNGEAGLPDRLILPHRSRRQGAPLLTRLARSSTRRAALRPACDGCASMGTYVIGQSRSKTGGSSEPCWTKFLSVTITAEIFI